MKGWKRGLKRLMVAMCLCICLYCIGMEVAGLSAQAGVQAMLYAAGLEPEKTEAETGEKGAKQTVQQVTAEEDTENATLFLEEDGIVPFHQDELPAITEAPDPNRPSLPVEEIMGNGGQQVDGFYVKDTSSAGLDLAQELLQDPAVNIQANGEIEVLLYHTHTSEAYLDTFTGFYYTDFVSRSQNQEKNVVAVGEEIKKELEKAGIGVIHDTTVNDTMFNGSYARSWEVLQRNLETYPSIQVTIDIHRDSMTTEQGVKYKPTAEINGRKAAQIMLMTGCDINDDWGDFPDWQDNLHLALRVQQRASSMYPDLMRPMNFSDNKYNMNATKGSLLIEVGTEVNTLSEARYSGKLMGEVLADLLPELHAAE